MDFSNKRRFTFYNLAAAFPDPTDTFPGNEMKDQIRKLCFFILYSFNIFIATSPSQNLVEYISNLCGSTTIPMLVNFLPGLLFYAISKQLDWKSERKHTWISIAFAIFGMG